MTSRFEQDDPFGEPARGAPSDVRVEYVLSIMRWIVNRRVRIGKTRACVMKRPAPARSSPGTHARDVSPMQGVARVARVVRRNERDILVTDRGKRAWSSGEQRRKKLNSWLVWGLSQSGGRSRDRVSIHPSIPDAVRVGGRSRALDKEKVMFPLMFRIKMKFPIQQFELEIQKPPNDREAIRNPVQKKIRTKLFFDLPL